MERVRLVELRWHSGGSEVRLGLPVLDLRSKPCFQNEVVRKFWRFAETNRIP
jgi:hypothetical protein